MNLLKIYVLALYVAWFRNYTQYSTGKNVIKGIDFYRLMHNIAGCHTGFQVRIG
jgi:hypothetical protein